MGVAAFLVLLATQAAAPAPPPRADDLPARAVDHVVVMEERRADCATCPLHRRAIARSGFWVKDERVYVDHSETIYSDFASGTSFTVRRNRAGAVERLLIERDFERGGRYGVRRERTGRTDALLGEACEIWSIVNPLLNLEMEACETADGILLWKRFLGRDSPRALSVERRAVRPDEVRPPPDLFAQAPWPTLAAPSAADRIGYEVVLAVVGGRGTTTRRNQGRNFSGWSLDPSGGRLVWASGGIGRFSYSADGEGRPKRLEVDLRDPRRYVERLERVSGRTPQRVLGERCIWRDDVASWSSDTSYDCLTADGVPLIQEMQWHWTGRIEIRRARRVVRRPLTEADMAPPPEARDWASWGVTPPIL